MANSLHFPAGMGTGPRRALLLWVLYAGSAPDLLGRQFFPQGPLREKTWRWATGGALGVLRGPGELGRQPNATGGHEDLIATWADGVALVLQASLESRFGGVELRATQFTSAVQVRNEFGVAFPNHGGRPFAWSGNLRLYPLAPLSGHRSRLLRPFLVTGLGGLLVSVDLDNVKGQTLLHPFLWTLGGGLRLAVTPDDIPSWTGTFVELRAERLRTWRNRPLGAFEAMTLTLGLGMRL